MTNGILGISEIEIEREKPFPINLLFNQYWWRAVTVLRGRQTLHSILLTQDNASIFQS
jgi:hypothetical protein